MKRWISLLWVVCAAAGCDASPAAPGGLLDGTWVGSVKEAVGGDGTARLVLAQRDRGVSGTFTWKFGSVERSGTASGTIDGTTATVFLTPAAPVACSSSLTLTGTMAATIVVNGNRAAATYFFFGCGSEVVNGTFEVSRE